MFGFLAPPMPTTAWRQSYATICQYQRQLFGLTALPFLSYEAVFLHRLATDLRHLPDFPESAPTCCRLRQRKIVDSVQSRDAAAFAASFGMLLAGVKLQDNVNDSGGWLHRLVRRKYHRQVCCAHQILERLAPGLLAKVDAAIVAHAKLEDRSRRAPLSDYAAATGDGFAAVFAAFAQLVDGPAELFEAVGRHVGQAIISWDCAVDFASDQIRGHFNPLLSEAEVPDAYDLSLLELARLGWLLPEHCACRTVVSGVTLRVRARRQVAQAADAVTVLERWGLIRSRRAHYAGCDGCEALCAAAECGECLGAGAEGAGGCCAAGGGCPAEGLCCFPVECLPGSCRNKNSPSETGATAARPDSRGSPYEQYMGAVGLTAEELTPAGFVLLAENRIPARSASGKVLPSNLKVRVVRTDEFGVAVRPIDEPSA